MKPSRAVIAVTCIVSYGNITVGLLGATRLGATRCGQNQYVSAQGSCSTHHRLPTPFSATAAGGEGGGEDIVLRFKPSEVEVLCKSGEVALDVASRCCGMPEDSRTPFCRDGGCYNCEVEIEEASELGMVDNLVRACQFKVPEGAKRLTLIQMNSEEAFEDML